MLKAVSEGSVDGSTFEEYCKLLVRVADKSNRMVISDTPTRKKYLQQAVTYYGQVLGMLHSVDRNYFVA